MSRDFRGELRLKRQWERGGVKKMGKEEKEG